MKTKKYPCEKDSGQVIMFVIFVVLFLVMFVSLYISRSLLRQSKVSIGVVNSVQAYYIADTGAENVLAYMANMDPADTLDEGESVLIDDLFSSQGGTAMAVVSHMDATTLKIDIVGTYKSTSRAIQLFW